MAICFDLCDFNLTFVHLKARSTLLIVLALYLFNTLECYAVCILFSYMPFILVVQSLVHIVQLKSNSFVITVLEITHNLSLPLLLIMVAKMKVLSKLSFNVNIQNNLMQAMWCFNYLKKRLLGSFYYLFSITNVMLYAGKKLCKAWLHVQPTRYKRKDESNSDWLAHWGKKKASTL